LRIQIGGFGRVEVFGSVKHHSECAAGIAEFRQRRIFPRELLRQRLIVLARLCLNTRVDAGEIRQCDRQQVRPLLTRAAAERECRNKNDCQ